jgi:ABC-type uncharacterized transport system involved in gliding motility auxiliary subunit
MLVTHKTHRQVRIQNTLFLVLLLSITGSLAWLSNQYSFEADWSESGRNTLYEASTALLIQLEGPVSITSYATEDENIRRSITSIIKRYQRHKTDISLVFVNPDLVPDEIRTLGITLNGELLIEYQGRKEKLKNISEQSITNALQRLARSGERWLVFLDGHGERKADGMANHDLNSWVQQLKTKGFKVQSHTLAKKPQLPDNTRVLVLVGPQVNLLPGEVTIITKYVTDGGNLLWLTDPGDQHGLTPLARALGISFEPGTIVDPTTQMLGLSDPRFTLVSNYATHDITKNIDALTLYPKAVGFKVVPPPGWASYNLLRTEEHSWSETGKIAGSVQFNSGTDVTGPFTIGIALTRKIPAADTQAADSLTKSLPSATQRIVVIGDGDFLSNAYLGNGANLKMGMNVINWLAHDDNFINIPLKMTADKNLQLSPMAQGLIGIGFLFVIPLSFAGAGFFVWWSRRKR